MEAIKTQYLTKISFDINKLNNDLVKLNQFSFADPYGEFHYGKCVCCYLWNENGDKDDPFLSSYSHEPKQTVYGRELEYLSALIVDVINVEHLRFARIARLQPKAIIIPHQDYIELNNEFHRLHIPLKTDEQIFFGDTNNVYNLKLGEIWYLEAKQIHSVASFSDEERIHLILDFDANVPFPSIFKDPKCMGKVSQEYGTVKRPRLSAAEVKAISSLSNLIDQNNYKDILAILIRKYFTRNFPLTAVYTFLLEAAHRTQDTKLITIIEDFINYFLCARKNQWSPELNKQIR